MIKFARIFTVLYVCAALLTATPVQSGAASEQARADDEKWAGIPGRVRAATLVADFVSARGGAPGASAGGGKTVDADEFLGGPAKLAKRFTFNIGAPDDTEYFVVRMDAGDKLSVQMDLPAGYDDSLYQYRICIEDSDWSRTYENPSASGGASGGAGGRVKFATYVAQDNGPRYVYIISESQRYDAGITGGLTMTKVPADSMDGHEVKTVGVSRTDSEKTTNDFIHSDFTLPGGHGGSAFGVSGMSLSRRGNFDSELDVDWYSYENGAEPFNAMLTMSGGANMEDACGIVILDARYNLKASGGAGLIYEFARNSVSYVGVYIKDGMFAGVRNDASYTLTAGESKTKEFKLDDYFCGSRQASTSDGAARYYLGSLPANKLVVASIEPSGRDNANEYIVGGITLTDAQYNYMNYRGNSSAKTCMIYFIVPKSGEYTLNIENNGELDPPRQYTIHVYTADYITPDKAFDKRDATDSGAGAAGNYLIFNAPEFLKYSGHLGDNYRYLSKMQVRGNANIYWEHVNEFGRDMIFGLLLHNSSRADANATINIKSAHHTGSMPRMEVPLQIWDDYCMGKIKPDSTGISGASRNVSIQAGGAQWIYLDYVSASSDGLLNGIINLTVRDNARLDCYAFMVGSGDALDMVEEDFRVGDRRSELFIEEEEAEEEGEENENGEGAAGATGGASTQNAGDSTTRTSASTQNAGNAPAASASTQNAGDAPATSAATARNVGGRGHLAYTRADGGAGELSGATDGPVLVSGNINLNGRSSYRLLLAGDDAPMLNAGEDMPLLYDGKAVAPKYADNARNYAVIYRLNISGFSGDKAVFQYNSNTNPNYLHDPDTGIYVAYTIWYKGQIYDRGYHTLLQPHYSGFYPEASTNRPLPAGQFTIDIVISGMSSMPLTLIFE